VAGTGKSYYKVKSGDPDSVHRGPKFRTRMNKKVEQFTFNKQHLMEIKLIIPLLMMMEGRNKMASWGSKGVTTMVPTMKNGEC
jgi:hypothetical protein